VGRLLFTVIASLTCGLSGCYYELDDIIVSTDQAIPDLGPDLTGVDLNSDGPRCSNGAPPYHVGELTDPPLDRWGAEALMPITVSPATTTVVLDPARRSAGEGSLRLDTKNGQAGLLYPGTRDADFDLTPFLYVSFTATADDSSSANDPGWQGAQPHLLLVSGDNDYFEYVPSADILPRDPGPLLGVTVPLDGGFGWTKNQFGSPDLRQLGRRLHRLDRRPPNRPRHLLRLPQIEGHVLVDQLRGIAPLLRRTAQTQRAPRQSGALRWPVTGLRALHQLSSAIRYLGD